MSSAEALMENQAVIVIGKREQGSNFRRLRRRSGEASWAKMGDQNTFSFVQEES